MPVYTDTMKKTFLLIITITALSVSSCGVHYSKPKQLDNYLYSIEYSDYNFEQLAKFANQLLYSNKKPSSTAACSAVRCDSLFGRNFDWSYDEMPEFVIFTEASEGRYASLGIASPIGFIKQKQVNGLIGKLVLSLLPAFTVDGVNEKGVACCVNVVPPGDCGYTVGTNPGKPKLFVAMLVRYILDKAASAREALSLLDDRDIYTNVAFGLKEEYHFMIADSVSTYVVEFVDNRLLVLEDRNIMTNFYLSKGVTPHAIGFERYDIIEKGYDRASREDGMSDILKSVWYSNFYTNTEQVWLSELCSTLSNYGLTAEQITTNPQAFETPFEKEREKFRNRSRKSGETWQTIHTSIYNLATRSLTVSTQEGDEKHRFSLRKK